MYGFLTGAALVSLGCAQTRDRIRSIKNPLINDTVALDKYLLKTGESGAPKIVSASGGSLTEPEGQTVEAEPGKVYELKKGPIIITSKKTKPRQPVITELSATTKVSENFSKLRGLARLLIEPYKDWRINPSISVIGAIKKYDSGRDLEVQGIAARASVGKYFEDGLKEIFGDNSKLYAELGISGETQRQLNRVDASISDGLMHLGFGLFSPKNGTNLAAILGAGTGKYKIEINDIEQKEAFTRIIAGMQLRQRILSPVYARARTSLSMQDLRGWVDYTAVAAEAGLGIAAERQTDGLDSQVAEMVDEETMPIGVRAQLEALLTGRHIEQAYGRDAHKFFICKDTSKNILGVALRGAAQLNNNWVVKATLGWDEDLGFGGEFAVILRY